MNENVAIALIFILDALVIGCAVMSILNVQKYARRCRQYASLLPAAEKYWECQPHSPEKIRIQTLIDEIRKDLHL